MQLSINAGVDKLLPSLTGWAQINGRDEISLKDKVALEKEYLEKKSILLDLKIILLTFTRTFTSKGVTH